MLYDAINIPMELLFFILNVLVVSIQKLFQPFLSVIYLQGLI